MKVNTPSSVPNGNDAQLIPAMTIENIRLRRCAMYRPERIVSTPNVQPKRVAQEPMPIIMPPNSAGDPGAVLAPGLGGAGKVTRPLATMAPMTMYAIKRQLSSTIKPPHT